MKKITILSFLALVSIGCGNSAQQSNSPVQQNPANNTLTVSSRSQNPASRPAQSGTKSKWTQSGDPIDTTEYDAEIAKAEKAQKAKPNDEAAKKALAEAYFKRGVALTDARQYASALGDYRKAAKLDPNHAEAKRWIGEIVAIYDGLNKSYPEEGEEPPPLPFDKKT